jgi:predicted DNA-binding transcriptional regulator AlpA
MTHHLVGPAEIGTMLGITRQRVHQLALEDDTFPEPEATLATGRVWTREAVEAWAKATGRLK